MTQTGLLSVKSQLLISLNPISSNWDAIRAEMMSVPKNQLYHPSKNMRFDTYVDRNKWCHYAVKLRSGFTKKAKDKLPITCGFINQVPNVFRAALVTMMPGVFLPPHVGDYKKAEKGYEKMWRYHLCLDQDPKDYKMAGMVIDDEVQRWKVGGNFIFNEGSVHSAWNYGQKPRTILLVDILSNNQ